MTELTRAVERVEGAGPCSEKPNLGAENLARLAVERREQMSLRRAEAGIEGREELGAELGGHDSASSPIARIGATLDQARRFEVIEVVTASGEEISADYAVLATGSKYPFPAKTDLVDTHHAQEQVRQAHRALAQADRVLLVGAGPVGIELAGEIRHVWPEKSIVLLDVADEILGGPYVPELKAELRRQLIEARVELILDSPLRQAPPTQPGELGTFTVTTEAGTEVIADIWFRCYGVVPNSDYLGDALAPARRADWFIEVGPTLQVAGQTTVFAVGDISTADSKMAAFAGYQGAIVADNINALAQGRSDLAHYKSAGVAIAVPIGPNGGAGQFPGQDEIVGREIIAEKKGREMGVDRLRERFGLATPAAR